LIGEVLRRSEVRRLRKERWNSSIKVGRKPRRFVSLCLFALLSPCAGFEPYPVVKILEFSTTPITFGTPDSIALASFTPPPNSERMRVKADASRTGKAVARLTPDEESVKTEVW
jgi:hypothetical protein